MNKVRETLDEIVTALTPNYSTSYEGLLRARDKIVALRDGKIGNYRPENVPVAVDLIIRGPGSKIVMIERHNEPHGFALPGGFMEQGESLVDAAVREAKEETGLDVHVNDQFWAYSKPGRDPRGSVVSVVFLAFAIGEPKAGDDAKTAKWFKLGELPPRDQIVFDHAQIVFDYVRWIQNRDEFAGRRPSAYR